MKCIPETPLKGSFRRKKVRSQLCNQQHRLSQSAFLRRCGKHTREARSTPLGPQARAAPTPEPRPLHFVVSPAESSYKWSQTAPALFLCLAYLS